MQPNVEEPAASTDSLVFDKGEEAASVSNLRGMLQNLQERLNGVDGILAAARNAEATEAASNEKADLENRIDRLTALIDKKETKIAGK